MDIPTCMYPLLWIVLHFAQLGNVASQGGGGVAVGLGLGADFMMDTALGEMPNPLFLGSGVTNAPLGGGGGFGSGGMFSLFGPDPGVPSGPFLSGNLDLTNAIGAIDPTNAQGAAFFSDGMALPRLQQLNNIANPSTENSFLSGTISPWEPYVLQNEAFTALGSIGQAHKVMSTTEPTTTQLPPQILKEAASGTARKITDLDGLRKALRAAAVRYLASPTSGASQSSTDLDAVRRTLLKSATSSSTVSQTSEAAESSGRISDIEALRRALIRAVINSRRTSVGPVPIPSNASAIVKLNQQASAAGIIIPSTSDQRSVSIPLGRVSNFVTSTSSNTISHDRKQLPSETTTTNPSIDPTIPHLEDLTANGIYPFEGSFAAKDALVNQSTAVINDLNKAIQSSSSTGAETLHLENPYRGEFNSDISVEPFNTITKETANINAVQDSFGIVDAALYNNETNINIFATKQDIINKTNTFENAQNVHAENIDASILMINSGRNNAYINDTVFNMPKEIAVNRISDTNTKPASETVNSTNKTVTTDSRGTSNVITDSFVLSGTNGAPITNFEGIRWNKNPGSGLAVSSSATRQNMQGELNWSGATSSISSKAKKDTQQIVSDASSVLYQNYKNTEITGGDGGGGLIIGLRAQNIHVSPLTDSVASKVSRDDITVGISNTNKREQFQPSLSSTDISGLNIGSLGSFSIGNVQRAITIKPEESGKGFSVMPNIDSPGLPAKISDSSKVVDLSLNSNNEINPVEKVLTAIVREDSKKPFVGSIFGGSTINGRTSQGLKTTDASVDFMSTFLHHADTQNNIDGIPLNQKTLTDINKVQAKAKADNVAVDQFGVADIYTRPQKLDPSQWKTFLLSVYNNDSSVRPQRVVDYQTQNVVGAGETRALNADSSNVNSIENQLNKLVLLQQAQQELLKQRALADTAASNPSAIRTTFEAPGMGGQNAVSVDRGPSSGLISSNQQAVDGRSVVDLGFQTNTHNQVRQEQSSLAGTGADAGSFSIGKSVLVQDGGSPLSALTSTSLNELASNGIRLGQPIMMSKSGVADLLSGRTSVDTVVPGDAGAPGSNTFRISDILSQRAAGNQVAAGSDLRMAMFGTAGGNTITSSASGANFGASIDTSPSSSATQVKPPTECRYMADPTDPNYFFTRTPTQRHRLRCALGTAFDAATCECSTRVVVSGDCLEVHMDFNNGVVEDSSVNKLPIGNSNVEVTNKSTPLTGIALFGGDSKLTVWRYQNYDFRDDVLIKVQFRPGPGGDRYQPLLSNCDGSLDGPSIGIIYDSQTTEVKLQLKTDNDTRKELSFSVNPDEWNDVTFIYDGQEFIGIVNGVRRYVSRQDPHLLGIIGGEIKALPTQGLIEIRDAAIVLGHCPRYGYYRGAMVDIQIYACIPKDFRLE